MGLSGRKTKQRIGADPRNLTWADNAAKFGQSYLSKLGWDPSKGLGANQDGRTSHIQVAQKLNMLGIGAGAPQGPDAVAWKQNRDYELLLKRLNESNNPEEGEKTGDGEDKGIEVEDNDAGADAGQKRKREEGNAKGMGDDERKREKKRIKSEKKEKASKKEKKAKSTAPTSEYSENDDKKSKSSSSNTASEDANETKAENTSAPIARRPLAHRARFLRSKQLASQSSTAVAEILGISPSVSGSATPTVDGPSASGTSSSTLTSTTLDESIKMEQLTKSTKSVADYFKEKLASRSKLAFGTTTPVATSSVPDVKKEWSDTDRDEEVPTAKLGIGASRLAKEEDEPPKFGLGSGMKFGNLMGGLGMSFPPFTPSASAIPPAKAETDVVKEEESESEELQVERKRKKGKKDKIKDEKNRKGKESESLEPVSDDNETEQTEDVNVAREVESKVDRKERKKKDKEDRKTKKERKRKDKPTS